MLLLQIQPSALSSLNLDTLLHLVLYLIVAKKKSRTHTNRFLLISVLFLISFIIILKYGKTSLSNRIKQDQINDTTLAVNHVPDLNEKVTEEGLAVPKTVQGTSSGSQMKIRSFDIIANKDIFSVKKIIVYQNDVIRIQFAALDKDYDFTIPAFSIYQKAQKGETKMLEFQAISDGTFTFSCDACGGASKSMKGILIVVPKT